MANRIRNERLEIKLTEEEKALFEEKRKLAKCRNMSHFIRKCVLEKEIYQVDLKPFRDLQGLLSDATNNINQIAKRVNSTGVIYKEDIGDRPRPHPPRNRTGTAHRRDPHPAGRSNHFRNLRKY